LEYAKSGIRVNAVCPGTIKTPHVAMVLEDPQQKAEIQTLIDSHPIGRLGDPEEVAEAVLFLCSPKTAFVTGVCLPVDGGATAA
jgi:NAD(P)-dependent dehydrogenase (short-subunit alcohol dehydrogenase family)